MKFLLTIFSILFIGCNDNPISTINEYGCTDSTACNFNSNATIYVPNSCIYEEKDCLGVCGGDNTLDQCGICDNNLTNNCIQDECGIWAGDGTSCNRLVRGYVYDNFGSPIENAYIFLGYEITTRPSITLQLSINQAGELNAWVENECDEIISTLIDNEYYNAGYHAIAWNGLNSNGLNVLDGVYEINISINDEIYSQNIVVLLYPPDNFMEDEPGGYQPFCIDDNGESICDYAALTNSNGYFEFSQDCLSLGHEWQGTDAQGNEIGNQFLSRLRLFADDGQKFGTSNYFEVDPYNGAEINIIIESN